MALAELAQGHGQVLTPRDVELVWITRMLYHGELAKVHGPQRSLLGFVCARQEDVPSFRQAQLPLTLWQTDLLLDVVLEEDVRARSL